MTTKQLNALAGKLAGLILVSALCFGALASNNNVAVEAFQRATADILEQGRLNGEQYGELVNEMGDIMAASESARVALKSGNTGRLESLARSNATLGKRYIAEYRKFLKQLDANSSCARHPQTRKMLDQVEELERAANNIGPLAATQDEVEAYAALMEINQYQVLLGSVPNMFEAAQLCIVQDSLPALVENMQQLEALMGTAVDDLATNAVTDQVGEVTQPGDDNWIKPSEHIASRVSFYPDQTPSFNDLSMVYVENRGQLDQLNLSNGLQINEQLMLVLPASTGSNGHYSANLTGTVETQDYIATLDIHLERLASTPVSGLTGISGPLKACIDNSAKQQMAEYAHQLTLLSCEFPANETVSLAPLSNLPQLTMLTVTGGSIGPLTPLSKLTELSNLMLANTQVQEFGDLSGIHAVMQFSHVKSNDWVALASSRSDTIMLEQIPDCSSLSPLANSPEVALLLGKATTAEFTDYLNQLDSGEKRIGIIANCVDE